MRKEEVIEAIDKLIELENQKQSILSEYQDAKRAYDELVAKYAELLLNTGESLMGVSPKDMKALEACAKYGVDVSHFYGDITKAAHSKNSANSSEIDYEESTMKM